jgi:prepilin-type N-terminal cleavage/methylation domain-containing protein
MKSHRNISGFTLVELAIVLVVIGLIVSGVLVGQQLIEQARIRKVLTQVTQYDQAISAFRLKYDYLPGDFPQAHRFFGSFSGCSDEVNDSIDPSYTSTGCNGNGDGYIGIANDSIGEVFLLWAHLSLAGLVAGTYTGFPIDVSDSSNLILWRGGVNAPKIGSHGAIIGTGSTPEGKIYHDMAAFNTAGELMPGFSINEAYAIDSKRDDGKPDTGTVVAENVMSYADCVTAGAYNIGTAGVLCILAVYAQ